MKTQYLKIFIFAFLCTQVFSSNIIDLTHVFDKNTIYWPTEKGFSKQPVFYGKKPDGYFYSAFKFCTPEHGGTHIDAPLHFSEHGLSVDKINPEQLVGKAIVIDVHEKVKNNKDYFIGLDDIKKFEKQYRPIQPGDIVLFRTDWSKHWNNKKQYLGTDQLNDLKNLHFPGISAEVAKYLALAKVKGIGIDSPSMDTGISKNFWVHRIILGANLYGLENLKNLNQLKPLDNNIIIAPMKIKGGSGGPTRVFVINNKKQDN